jgi:uncharacterized membrane protein YhfC
MASLAGQPEQTFDFGIVADNRIPVRREGSEASPAAFDAVHAVIDQALIGGDSLGELEVVGIGIMRIDRRGVARREHQLAPVGLQ